LGYHPGQKRAYSHGETVKLVVRVRNVGKKKVKFQYVHAFFVETPPAVTDAQGKLFRVEPFPTAEGEQAPKRVDLAPGKEIEIYELKFKLRPDSKDQQLDGEYPRNIMGPDWLWGLGKVRVQYERLASAATDAILSKLATGKLELEIKSATPAATGKKTPQRKDREDAKMKPLKVRVYIEKVNVNTSSITASCMTIGQIDNAFKPLRLENLQVSEKAKITDRGKEVKLTDLQLLPRDTGFYLFLEAHELGFEVVGIETIRK
jgi:hypothetical protein